MVLSTAWAVQLETGEFLKEHYDNYIPGKTVDRAISMNVRKPP